jgi:hypothetical protein
VVRGGHDPDWSHLDGLILLIRVLIRNGCTLERIVALLQRDGYVMGDIYLCYQAALILERR